MFYNILDQKRLKILPKLENFRKNFYLAGGTALALQFGHRDSVDFDFFSENEFDTKTLFEKIEKVFEGYDINKVQEEGNTLTVIVDKNIKISFFAYRYQLLKKLVIEEYLRMASVEDIACMKLSAIVSRSTLKDYVDLYFILQKHDLNELISLVKIKFPTLDTNLVLKSLVYFEDIKEEPINFKNNKEVSLEEIKNFLKNIVKNQAGIV